MDKNKKKILIKKIIKKEEEIAIKLSDKIWELAEPPLLEKESSKLIAQYLEANGFNITWPFKVLPTAFKAEKGKGRPVPRYARRI